MVVVHNPEHRAWLKQDQAILSAIVSSLTPSVSGLVLFAASAYDAWNTLHTSFNSQSTARSMQIRNQLGQMKKRDQSAAVFFNQVKTAADTLASIGQPLRDEEFAGFILNGLDQEYDGLVEAVEGQETPISVRDLHSRLLSTEQRIESRRASDIYSDSSANAASRSNSGTRGPASSTRRARLLPRHPLKPTMVATEEGPVAVKTIVAAMIATIAMIVMTAPDRYANSVVSLVILLPGATSGLTVNFWVLAMMALALHDRLLWQLKAVPRLLMSILFGTWILVRRTTSLATLTGSI
jgi:hypothetical protein